ncbi:subtilisin-like protein [Myriangium duriaei CBS 260.36]|uniref:tripeptidyl-peptidase II n=1 Tax=Myriangium duriaei CBS 260.36 TaxID=1168546 RepID=A0A9P4J694_9PEZI|nr:subtilisin-like protein [Myriangium duriaei CBS 260.36]
MLPQLLTIAGLLAGANAAIHEQLAAVPAGWTFSSTASKDQALDLSISLQGQSIDQLDSKLADVSTPGSANYGKYLSQAEVAALLAPSKDSVSAVTSWLSNAGIKSSVSADGTSIDFSATVEKANSLLSAKFANYKDSTGAQKTRTLEYSLPDNLLQHVDIITPTTFFGRTSVTGQRSAVQKRSPRPLYARQETPAQINSTCNLNNVTGYVTFGPECLRLVYNVTYEPSVSSGSRIAFGSFLNQSAQYADLAQYEQTFGIPAQNFSVVLINNGKNVQNATSTDDGEANLDVENIVGIAHPLPVTEYITGGSPPFVPNVDEPTPADNENEPYLEYYNYLLAQPAHALPQVITNSYGDTEATVPEKYARRVCNLIGLVGLRGITVLESSGDLGVGSGCRDANNKPQFTPIFPATCPYIFAIGGTQSFEPEVAWTGSSGGFSNYFPTAFYQKAAVGNYLSTKINHATKRYFSQYANFQGRGFPDVAAHSLRPDYQVIVDGQPSPSGGTSAAAPVWAGIVALLNDARLKAGKPTMGFINPWIYSIGYTALTDITLGGSVGCNGVNSQTGQNVTNGAIIPYASWNATQGWDPVTGLGVPNAGRLIDLALSTC